jgi:hypothetical protein
MNRQEKTIIITATISLSLAVILVLLLPQILNSFDPKGAQFAGLVIKSQGDVRIRFGESVNWRKLANKDKIFSNSYLFTGEESLGNFGFIDESSLNLGPNSLVYIGIIHNKFNKSKDDSLQLELVNGQMQIDLKKLSKIQSLKVADATIELTKESSTIRLENTPESMEVSVMQGDAKITSKEGEFNVKSGERLEVKASETPEVSAISPEVLEEMKKLSDEDRKMLLAEYQKNRNISALLASLLERIFN